MEFKIINQKKNPFLNREELVMELVSNSTPSKDSVVEAIGKDKELVVVKKISSGFGTNKFGAEAFVYDSKKDREKVETIPKKVKKKMEEERKKAEEAAKKEAEAKAKAEAEAAASGGSEASEDTGDEESGNEKTEAGGDNKSDEVKDGNE